MEIILSPFLVFMEAFLLDFALHVLISVIIIAVLGHFDLQAAVGLRK